MTSALSILVVAGMVLSNIGAVFAAVTSSSATFNGSSSATVSPSASVTASITAVITNSGDPTKWRSTGWEVGTSAPAAGTKLANCVDTSDTNGNAGGNSAVKNFTITAPAAAGTYNVYFALDEDDGTGSTACGDGTNSHVMTLTNVLTVTSGSSSSSSSSVSSTSSSASSESSSSVPSSSSSSSEGSSSSVSSTSSSASSESSSSSSSSSSESSSSVSSGSSSSSEGSSSSVSSTSSSASSVSSFFAESSSSESSEASSESTVIIEANSGDDGNISNSHRGSDTNRVLGALPKIASNHGFDGTTPPAGFGGTNDIPLSDGEINFLCSIQRSIKRNSSSVLSVIAASVSQLMGRDADFIEAQLQNTALCADINALLRPQTIVLQYFPRPVVLAEDGYPVSSNDTWNKCVRGTATLEDIKNNPDYFTTRSGVDIPKDCGWYRYTGSTVWKYPDDPYLNLTINDSKLGTKFAPTVSANAGYIVVKPVQPVVSK